MGASHLLPGVSCRTLHKSMARALPPNLRQPIKNSSRSKGASIKIPRPPQSLTKGTFKMHGVSSSSESPLELRGYDIFRFFFVKLQGCVCIQYTNMFPVHIKGQSEYMKINRWKRPKRPNPTSRASSSIEPPPSVSSSLKNDHESQTSKPQPNISNLAETRRVHQLRLVL